jgi:hypothetical protein
MTNATIILNESLYLVEEGVLETTGEKFTTLDGREIELPEAIHTFQKWKQLGFSVKKGEKAIAKFPIWKYKSKKIEVDGEEEETSNMFLQTAAFFKFSQVEKMAN